jgi:hypothetical protein
MLADSFIVDFEGGGWCYGTDDNPGDPMAGPHGCTARAKTFLGSSLLVSETMPFPGGFLSDSPHENPDFYNWTKVFVNYCDGLSFTGDRTEPVVDPSTNASIYFRGKRNLEAVIDALTSQHGLQNAKRIIVSGNSAGGLTVYLHLDQIAAMLRAAAPQASVLGFPDAGFFLDIPNATGHRSFRQKMDATFQLSNGSSGIDPQCAAANPGNASNCMFAQYAYPHLRTSLFALQGSYDSWQIGNILQLKDPAGAPAVQGNAFTESCAKSPTCNASFQGFHSALTEAFAPAQSAKGVFLSSCIVHCQATVDGAPIWSGHAGKGWMVANKTVARAFGDCYFGRGSCRAVDALPWPDNPTCS